MALCEVLAEPPTLRSMPGKISRWRETLADADLVAFDAAVRNPAWSHVELARALTGAGFSVSEHTIRAYRRRIS